ncbi:Alpha/Beta hydrolase protein [Talaromyces proteolyticus]|uniref:Alpha/Beta hydrolase protein n=1 Tax=Talaromyces proteolyticus TaxID=1131652 RepID=A0AAD4KSE2_9EURO|nr:Alpha/Beta hydrolase protein [Talaromyces proteolyticus]KAH8698371.1 Alpha/Beta hydrolase protein [Talaromyces proteolyticus]
MSVTFDSMWAECLRVIANETGFGVDDIDDDDDFTTDLGVNPIVLRSMVRCLKVILKQDIPSAVFTQYPTIKEFREGYLQACFESEKSRPQSQHSDKFPALVVGKNPKNTPNKTKSRIPVSMVLQGKPATDESTTNIFLLPDGSGSGMAYAAMPHIYPYSVCLIAMNSPYLNSATEYRCSINEIARQYVKEIRQRQPHGPYIIGGWSAGGYYSTEVVRELARQGERVRKLILLDSPCRPDFEDLPMEVVEYLSRNNLMGNWGSNSRIDNVPQWVLAHFRSTLRAVREYIPEPVDSTDGPEEVCIIWSRDGVLPIQELEKTGLDLSVRVSRFLLEGKPDLTRAYGWDRLFPESRFSISSMPGNHFSLINKPNINELAVLLRDVVTEPSQRQRSWYSFQ